MTTFSSSFITEKQTAFTEFVTIGSLISQNVISGKESIDSAKRATKILTVLEALDCSELTTKEEEALDYQLTGLLEGQFVPTVTSLYSV